MSDSESKVIILHAPVLHAGYMRFFEKHKDAAATYLLGEDILTKLNAPKEIRACTPQQVATMLTSLKLGPSVYVLDLEGVSALQSKTLTCVVPSELVSKEFVARFLPETIVEFDTIFLRWDESSVMSSGDVKYDEVSNDPFDKEMIERAGVVAKDSTDWWRHVGAVVVKDGRVILESHNTHLPGEQTQYLEGDPRDFIQAGTSRERSAAIHAEQIIVAEAARCGISLDGASIYMNVFPCNLCAQLITAAGIKKCFYQTGNAYLNVEEVFAAFGAKIILVQ